jgi:hypothetical protein
MRDHSKVYEALIVVIITGAAVLFLRIQNPGQGAERHFYRTNRFLFWTMKLCYLVIFTSLVLHGKVLVLKLLSPIAQRLLARP